MANLVFKDINKIYPNNVQAVFDFNLEVKDREFIVFVGPSGCGKTTTLRMLAGLEDITSGEIYIDGELVNNIQPKHRDVAMVFQNYALYPHMSVYDNLAFSLEMKKYKKDVIKQKVNETASLLGIEEYLDRKPKALSGGQRQRVALGRAIIRNAKVFLMDEPLSNLDAKLRVQMRTELIRLHQQLESTTIYVTHDQTEAMTMATRIVVMNEGYIQQVGTPEEVYTKPVNLFVASFLGSHQMNMFEGTYRDGLFQTDDGRQLRLLEMHQKQLVQHENERVILGIRPEDIYLEGIVRETYPGAVFTVDVDVREMLGDEYVIYGKIGEHNLTFKADLRSKIEPFTKVEVTLDMSKLHIFDAKTGITLAQESL